MNETKKKRRWLRRFFVFFISLFLLLVSFLLLISYNSSLQTYIVSKVNKSLKESLDIELEVQNVRFELVKSIDFKGVLIKDHRSDTLFYAESIEADLELFSVKGLSFNLDEFNIKNSVAKVIHYETDSLNSFSVFLEKFKSDKSSKSNVMIDVDDVWIDELELSYYDERSDFKLSLNKTKIELEDFQLKGNDLSIDEYSILSKLNNQQDLDLTGGFSLDSNVLVFKKSISKFNDSAIQLEGKYDLVKMAYSTLVDINLKRYDIGYFNTQLSSDLGDSFEGSLKIKGSLKEIVASDIDIYNEYVGFNGEAKIIDFKSIDFELKGELGIRDVNDLKARFNLPFLKNEFFLKVPVDLIGDKDLVKGGIGLVQMNSNINSEIVYDVKKGFFTCQSKGGLDVSALIKDVPEIKVNLNNNLEFDVKNVKYVNSTSMRNVFYDQINLSNVICSIDGQKDRVVYVIEVNDRNLSLDATGATSFGDTLNIRSKFKLNKIYPSRLGLISGRDKGLRFQSNGFTNIKFINSNEFQGFVQLSDFKFKELVYRQNLDHLSINFSQSNKSSLTVFSDWLNVKMKGEYEFSQLTSIAEQFKQSFLEGETPKLKEDIDLSIDIPRLYPLAKIADIDADAYSFYAEGNVSDSTTFSLSIDSLRFKNKKINNATVEISSNEGTVCQIKTDSIKISNKPLFKSFANKLTIKDKVVYNSVYWDASDEKKSNGLLSINSDLSRDTLSVNITKGEFYINDMHWFFNNNKPIVFEDERIVVHNVSLNHKDESLRFYGVLGEKESDSINFQLDHINLETFRPLLNLINLKIDGIADGVVSIKSVLSNPETDSYLNISDFKLNGEMYKDLKISSKYKQSDRKVLLNAELHHSKDNSPIVLEGEYYPFKEEESLNATMSFKNFRLKDVSNYFESFATIKRGYIDGDILLKGSPRDFYLLGYLTTKRVRTTIDYLGVTVDVGARERIYFDKEGIKFNNLEIIDPVSNNSALLNGYLLHQRFSNFLFDLRLDFNKFTCLNTNKDQNDLYYGNVIASGNMTVTGDPNNVLIDVNAKTDQFKKGRDLHSSHLVIPFESSTTVGSQEFLTFKTEVSKKVKKIEENLNSNGMELRMKLDVGDEAEMKLVFDSQVGDQIRAKGNANLQLNLTTQGKFEMYGDYKVKEGEYLFTMESVINKKFKIKEGGTVSWTGDPYSGTMNMEAYYEVKTSLFDLLQYTVSQDQDSSLQAQRYEDLKREYGSNSIVHCLMNMSGDVMRPDIVMDLDFLDINEKTKLTIGSMISSEDEKMKQIVSLMIWGRFLPPSQYSGSGGFINAGVNTTTNELISNQIDLWISQLSDDVDLGFNYDRANTLQGRDEISLEIGKRLNDRISFSGNFGVANRNHQSGLIGEFEVDYRITENIRLKGFNENNDIDPSKVTGYTQGASVEYKAEFNDFQELIEPIKKFFDFFKMFETKNSVLR